ncbi:unnamed protein product, partial [Ascophyllum nodosum]
MKTTFPSALVKTGVRRALTSGRVAWMLSICVVSRRRGKRGPTLRGRDPPWWAYDKEISQLFLFSTCLCNELACRASPSSCKCVANVLRDQDYQASSVQEWTEGICSATVTALRKISGLFKYTATCVLTEKTGAGLHTSSAACWEPAS